MKKLFSLLLAVMAATATLFADSGTCGENVNWVLKDGVLTISGTGDMYYFATMAPWYGMHNSITSVIIEDGVTDISYNAFNSCSNMTSVTIPNSVTSIGKWAFYGCNDLTSITLPTSLESIYEEAFYNCYGLTSLTLPASLKSIGNQAFYNCSGLTEITCEATTPPACEHTTTFLNLDKSIPVKVPDASVSAYKLVTGWNYFTNIQGISGGGGESCGENVNWVLKDGVLTISGTGDMYYFATMAPWYGMHNSITSVIIEDGVTDISYNAFNSCSNMTSVTIPNSVTSIGKWAFYGCNDLTSITLPTSLESIYEEAFYNCYGLTSITCEATTPPTCGYYAFAGVNKAIPVFVPKANITLYKAEFGWEDFTNYIAIEDKEAADAVIAKINAIGTVTYTPESKALIDAAREAYDALTDAQKGLVSAATYKILTDAEQTYADLKKKADADQAAANIVIGKINAIGTVTLSSEAAILDARSAYDALTADQKALVTNLATLEAAEKAYAELKAQAEADQAAANVVIGQINAIGDVTLASEPAIVAARTAYDALTDAQKARVSNYATLTAAEAKLDQLKKQAAADQAAADLVIGKIDAIGTVTLESEAAIVAARTAYDALTTDQKALVTNLATLEAAEKAYAELKAQAEADQAAANVVIGQINAIGEVTLASEPAIVAARSAYDALTDAQKARVSNYATLTAAEAKLDQLKKQAAADQAAADLVIGKINAIGTVSYTTASKALIDAARGAYDALTDAQKALVTNYATLTAAEKAYADLKAQAEADQAAANVVIGQINAIGDVTLASEPAIVAARSAYDALTDAQKALVTNYATLTAAEAKLEILKKQAESDEAAAKAVTDLINGIGAISYTTESKALIDAAREAYNALTDAQKALVTNYATLVAAEQVYEQLKAEAEADQKAANVVIALIDQIGEVTLASEPAINAARTAYNSLTSIQQELVTNYGTLLAAETTLELLKQQATIDQAMADDVIARIEAIGEVTYTNNCYSRIFDARAAYDALSDVQKALVTNYATLTAAEARYAELEAQAKAVEEAKTQLKALVSEAAELKAIAMLYSPASVEQIDAIIANAQQTIDDPNATVEDVNAKTEIIRGEIQFVGAALLEEAKEQLRQSIKALYQSGDYPSWYAAVIIPALNQVDEIMWDNDKTVQENILFFQTTGKAIYDTAKAALEALRASDTREIVSACEFTGFNGAITDGMMWNEAALNALVANLNASAATQPYHFNAEECMLTKWDAENELFVGVDHYEGVVLTPGDYQFVANISIDGEAAAQYRFPKATEATLSVTVDAAVWAVDLAGILIDATYSSAYTTSPTFTLTEGQGFEETQDAQLKTQKIYHNGHFYILRGEHIYDIQGTLVR